MKTILPLSLILLLMSSACDVVDPLDARDETRIPYEEAVTDLATAEFALTGVYAQLLTPKIDLYTGFLGALLGPEVTQSNTNTSGGNTAFTPFLINRLNPNDGTVLEAYRNLYKLINAANHLIDRLDPLTIEDPRKEEILGEARFLRAFCHLTLLQYWGQFFDQTSDYGIVLRKEPVRSQDLYTLVERSSVADSYRFILEDLNYAIAHAPAYPSGNANEDGGGGPPPHQETLPPPPPPPLKPLPMAVDCRAVFPPPLPIPPQKGAGVAHPRG